MSEEKFNEYWVSNIKLAEPPKNLWKVDIPANGQFTIFYTKPLNIWQRFWMRFIGWKVTKVKEDK